MKGKNIYINSSVQAIEVLHKAKLDGKPIEVHGACFRTLNLQRLVVPGSSFTCCDFSHADLRGSDLSRCNFAGSDFAAARLEYVNFRQSRLTGCDFSNSFLRGADMRDVILGCCNFFFASDFDDVKYSMFTEEWQNYGFQSKYGRNFGGL